ncbi:MAG: flagellar protein FliT [Lachnospiraceae bacterium]|nr:flagellar protein FliT [Lachnospiraceae bacterium]
MEENYINILIQSLEQKRGVLSSILEENEKQNKVLKADELDGDAFEETIERKAKLIEQIELLDSGFEKVYGHVKELLEEERDRYTLEIARMQQLIGEITGQTVKIQKQEQENRNLAEAQFANARRKVKTAKNTKRVASTYRTNMAKLNVIEPQFMDKKK